MKKAVQAILLLALVYSVSCSADCVKNESGSVVCGEGQCEVDQYGKVYCAAPGGGAIKDQYGNVQCGIGYCARDDLLKVWCSKKPGGGAMADIYGKVKCFDGCAAGSASLCQKARE